MDNLLKKQLKDNGYKGKFDLSSLIEACRDKNKKQLEISLHYVGGTTNHWEAKYMPKFIFTNGKSLEIAIAKLWLKLNKKQ